ncbi:MAG: hypothetical protein HZB21_06345, partial [Deltaproteobacteria bacterium]|nr:hypothetical protein [Deltaproteobacteria bacterium]
VLAENVTGANGLYFDRGAAELYVVSFGEGYKMNGGLGIIRMSETNPGYEPLTGNLGGLDGIAMIPGARIIFSDWVSFDKPGVIRVYDKGTKELSYLPLSQDVKGPADFYYDGKTGHLWLPRMMEGKVLIERIK